MTTKYFGDTGVMDLQQKTDSGNKKSRQKNSHSGDTGVMDPHYLPKQYDILLLDLCSRDLHELGTKLNLTYLGDASEEHIGKEISGNLWGPNHRALIPLVVRRKGYRKLVFFLIDTGAPSTYLSEETLRALGIEVVDDAGFIVNINGVNHSVHQSPPDQHFPDVNVLGTDFLRLTGAVLTIAYDHTKTVSLLFQDPTL